MQAAPATHADAGVSAAGRVHILKTRVLSAEKDLGAVRSERRSLRGKESQLVNISNSFEGLLKVLRPEFLILKRSWRV